MGERLTSGPAGDGGAVLAECVEPALIRCGLQATLGSTIFPDGSDQTVAADKVDHRNILGSRLTSGLRAPAQGQQNDPLGTPGLSLPLEQDHGLPADEFTTGVIALGPAMLVVGLCRYPLLGELGLIRTRLACPLSGVRARKHNLRLLDMDKARRHLAEGAHIVD